jgi:magnesium and cobalt transporter
MSEQPTGGTGRWLKRITQSMSGEPRDLAELIEDLREASERGLFDGDALVMLEGVLAVADMQVRDIMVPRSQMVFVERDESPDKLVELVVESGPFALPGDRRGSRSDTRHSAREGFAAIAGRGR